MYQAWEFSANDLLDAAALLRNMNRQPENHVIHEEGKEAAILPPELMLRGMALEAYFKAIWVKRGNELVKSHKFVGVPGVKSHDLVKLSEVLSLPISPKHRELLSRLSRYVEYAGRYPISKRAEKFWPTLGAAVDWSLPRDDDTFTSIRTMVSAELDENL
jgi:hypothetical protein